MTEISRSDRSKILQKLNTIVYEEVGAFQPRFFLINLIMRLIPRYTGTRTRTHLLRAAGVDIGHGTTIMGTVHIHGWRNIRDRLHIGKRVVMNIDCFLDLNESITIGNYVALGHEVMILTTSHEIGDSECRAGETESAPVVIEDGAWIGARSVVLPGMTVGAGSIVGSGAVVTKDVPPNTLVGGVPAKVIRSLNDRRKPEGQLHEPPLDISKNE